MSPFDLHVVTAIVNPKRFKSRARLYTDFAARMLAAGVVLWTVEVAYGNREHEVTNGHDPHHIQLRSSHEIWLKESALNVGIQHISRQRPD